MFSSARSKMLQLAIVTSAAVALSSFTGQKTAKAQGLYHGN
jgi:hypothetical protein